MFDLAPCYAIYKQRTLNFPHFYFLTFINSCTFALKLVLRKQGMGYLTTDRKKVTANALMDMKRAGDKITMLTAYDYTTARIIDQAGVDSILVGDSASNVMQGNTTTLPITLEEMIVYARGVARACQHALIVCDMPFGSYQSSPEDGVRNAIRLVKETGVDAVKLEGGEEITNTIQRIIEAGIPVIGHLGLTPQSVNKFGGYGVRAKSEAEAAKLISDAKALEEAGCFGIILEKIPAALAKQVTEQLQIPTIGIGAGSETDGQVLVYADAMGLTEGFRPKFLRQFAEMGEALRKGVTAYCNAVKSNEFPNKSESY